MASDVYRTPDPCLYLKLGSRVTCESTFCDAGTPRARCRTSSWTLATHVLPAAGRLDSVRHCSTRAWYTHAIHLSYLEFGRKANRRDHASAGLRSIEVARSSARRCTPASRPNV